MEVQNNDDSNVDMAEVKRVLEGKLIMHFK